MATLTLKSNVKLGGLAPQIVLAAVVVKSMFDSLSYPTFVTSANDLTHGPNSLHSRDGQCRAMDFRTKHVSEGFPPEHRSATLTSLRDSIRAALPGFDVILEDLNGANEHMHVEYDPK